MSEQNQTQAKILDNITISSNTYSSAFRFYGHTSMSLHNVVTGVTALGILSVQCSNDLTNDFTLVSNWVPFAGSYTPISGDTQVMYNLKNISFKWIRLFYSCTSGTGIINTNMVLK